MIKVHNKLIITLSRTKVKDEKPGNWLGAVSYMETKVTEDFGVEKGNRNQGHGDNNRRI